MSSSSITLRGVRRLEIVNIPITFYSMSRYSIYKAIIDTAAGNMVSRFSCNLEVYALELQYYCENISQGVQKINTVWGLVALSYEYMVVDVLL